ncbi:MAG: CBS domain-containing protein [Gilvibacter sp.]
MNTKAYLINDVKPIEVTTLVSEVQNRFNQLTYSHHPVVENGVFLGSVSETDVHCFESDKTIDDFKYAIEGFFVRDTTNWLDIIEAFAQAHANIMPVLDKDNTYIGYYELEDIMSLFSETPFLHDAGGIAIVEKGITEFSFSEISQIVETNDARLLGLFISKMEQDMVQITMKIAPTDMNSIVQTFRRYGYIVVSSHSEDTYLEALRDRSKYLDKYLNMGS